MARDHLAELHAVLDAEKAAIICGEYAALEDLAAQKEGCLNGLAHSALSKAAGALLKKRLQDNQALISAALKGVEAARARLSDLEKVRDGLTTYDLSGNVATVSAAQRRLEKKA